MRILGVTILASTLSSLSILVACSSTDPTPNYAAAGGATVFGTSGGGATSTGAPTTSGGNVVTPGLGGAGTGTLPTTTGGGATLPIGGSSGTAPGGGLAAKYAGFFPIGVAISKATLEADTDLAVANFNHLTADNAMKGQVIHPAEATWSTTEADFIAEFARAHGFKMTGHTLVWHRQQPAWMFAGLTAGDPASIETLKGRLKAHIEGMVERYADVVDNWDVVNEVISDDSAKDYRDDSANQWYTIFGSIDYVYWAFRYTKEALEAKAPGSSIGKLYYNDYNETQKVDRILKLCKYLETHPEGPIKIDGIGMQSHWRIDWPSATEISATIDKIAAAGYKAKISELDVTVYNDYPAPDYAYVAAPAVTFDAALDTQLATRYKAIFDMLRKQKANITSVTFWGIRDEDSWLRNEPAKNRPNFPLLWNATGPKAAYTTIQSF